MIHSRVLDALCGFGCGFFAGIGLCAAYLFSLAARILGERPIELVKAWVGR